uniref:RING-type E3 ubiquitin transferase n=1 Tax=Arabis nemorensis TaxID=586526 RepID=A0A565B4Q3_9BRAS
MTLSKQVFPLLLFSLFNFPLLHASNPRKCSSYYDSLRCGRFEDPIRFPFCGHTGFNLHCTDLNKTVLELPMSGIFLVDEIKYAKQQILINDPRKCLVKRLLTFNISGTPFSHRLNVDYTFLTCPKEVVMPSWYPPIPCLSNSTFSFFATSNLALANSMLPSYQVVKRVDVPASWLFQESIFSSSINYASLLLEWDSPNCKSCGMANMR